MAEIKSTMEKVLERAARLAAEADDQASSEELDRLGMKMAADFLNGEEDSLSKILVQQPAENQMAVRSGMARTLLRNIVLPRDADLIETGTKALQGLMDLSQSSKEIAAVCSEIGKLLGQYNQHREQLRQQLEQAIRDQLDQKIGDQGGAALAGQVKMNPAMHPQFQEEWSRMQGDLNNQYNQALDQRKKFIEQRLAP